jgi:hypothetical protein
MPNFRGKMAVSPPSIRAYYTAFEFLVEKYIEKFVREQRSDRFAKIGSYQGRGFYAQKTNSGGG